LQDAQRVNQQQFHDLRRMAKIAVPSLPTLTNDAPWP
jgi:hypothetical protein